MKKKTAIGTADDDEDDNDDDLRASPSFHKLFLRSLQLPTLSYTNQLEYTHLLFPEYRMQNIHSIHNILNILSYPNQFVYTPAYYCYIYSCI